MKVQGLELVADGGNEEADEPLTALTRRHSEAQTLLQDFFISVRLSRAL